MPKIQNEDINTKKLVDSLEPMIRRIVREELANILKKEERIFQLTPDMPLYEDMEDIALARAIRKGESEGTVSKNDIFNILENNE